MTDSGDRGGSGLLKAPTPFDYSYFSVLVDAPVQEAVGMVLVPREPSRADIEYLARQWGYTVEEAMGVYDLMLGRFDAAPQREAAKDDGDGAERYERHLAYSCDLQRIIEDLCAGREIRPPETAARFHYDMAVAYRTTLRAAIERIKP